MSMWKRIMHQLNGARMRFDDVGIRPDGTLYNPNGYPENEVRAAVLAAEERQRERRSKRAKMAAETRRLRRERLVHITVQRILAGHPIGPRANCAICRRCLDDPQSVHRGIGPECWQDIMRDVTRKSMESRS